MGEAFFEWIVPDERLRVCINLTFFFLINKNVVCLVFDGVCEHF